MANDKNADVVFLSGKMMYARLFTPDTRYEPKYTTDLMLNADEKAKAEAAHINVRMNEKYANLFEGFDGAYIRADRKVQSQNGDREPPEVKDGQNRPVDANVGIGNGTDATVRILIKKQFAKKDLTPAEAKKKWGGYPVFLTGVKITNLVPYERKQNDGGYYGSEDDATALSNGNSGRADDNSETEFEQE